MRTRRIYVISATMLLTILGSCRTPAYLPEANKLDVNQYGSRIRITHAGNARESEGELIAIDRNQIIILTGNEQKCLSVPLADVKHFKLQYAKPKHYGWTIPVGVAVSVLHGYYAAITLPLNLITTISVTLAGENAFQYSDRNMTYEKLKMFARFPQGIPPKIDMATIR